MGRRHLFLLVGVLIAGCSFHSAPADNVEFRGVVALQEFEGRFTNLGEVEGEGAAPVYLSAQIWPKEPAMAHDTITAVEVWAENEDTLLVRALRQDAVARESRFVLGKDFQLREGRIQLNSDWALLNEGAGDPLVGPRYSRAELGLDTRGNAKYRSQGAAAGLIFMMLPVALSLSEEVRFVRMEGAALLDR
jgi:hypothetical protein